MRAVKSKDTRPEMVVRRHIHALGYRYRLHVSALPGKPDIVFKSRMKVIFVNGCFWHGHHCGRGSRTPKTNREYWVAKIASNVLRDKRNREELTKSGWKVLTIWECETRDLEELQERICSYLE